MTPSGDEVKILQYLHVNPHAEHEEIAGAVSLKLPRVRYCMGAMQRNDRDWIERVWKIDPSVLGFPERYRVDISVVPTELHTVVDKKRQPLTENSDATTSNDKQREKGTQRDLARHIVKVIAQNPKFKRKIFVEEVSILLGGPADLSATVCASDNKAMFDFVTDGLRKCQAIASTSTCLEEHAFPL